MALLEIVVQDPSGVETAARASVDRIELCSALAVGGLTPSLALIRHAADGPVPVHVLVRPRAGGFDFSPAERRLIVEDARLAIEAGAAGVVVGGTSDGRVDRALVSEVRAAVGPAEVTFHRAIDAIADRPAALETLIDLGVTRVLTSGGAPSAADGVGELQRMVEQADGRIQIMAGGGVTAENVGAVAAVGVDAVHASARRVVTLSEGPAVQAGVSELDVTDEDHVRRLREALAAVSAPREGEAAWPRR